MEKTVFDEISDDYPKLTNTEIRNLLAAFLFTGDDVFKPISALSGGERGRVSLAKLMLSEANFLILDEPTNHLDIISKEILEDALNNYEGTVLYVSHDRYFINRTATRILELTNHKLVNYIGNYDYYLEKKKNLLLSMPPDSGREAYRKTLFHKTGLAAEKRRTGPDPETGKQSEENRKGYRRTGNPGERNRRGAGKTGDCHRSRQMYPSFHRKGRDRRETGRTL